MAVPAALRLCYARATDRNDLVTLRTALAQLDPVVGDVDGNAGRVLSAWRRAHELGADVVVFPELVLTGYPPEDLVLRGGFVDANLAALGRVAAEGPDGTVAVVGYVGVGAGAGAAAPYDVAIAERSLTNSAGVLAGGRVTGTYAKWRLPNYGVFDEARYFQGDDDRLVVRVAGVPVGVTICEDLWVDDGPVGAAARRGARVVLSLNASPYHRGKRADRERWARRHAAEHDVHVVYVNAVGGQDEVVFDGDSFVVDPGGDVVARGAQFAEDLVVADLDVAAAEAPATDLPGHAGPRPDLAAADPAPRLGPVAEVWEALVCGTRSYCHKNGFRDAIVGLSGGIDSAVTAAVAAAALGPDHVTGVAMPSPHSSEHSLDDAEALAHNLGITYRVVPIGTAMSALDGMLDPHYDGADPSLARENVQARIRGIVTMALSNASGAIVLTTGNKSEMAVGYATLYGDMAGGFAVLKDVPKLLVYDLAEHRNRHGEVVPRSSITKPPSAELRPDQVDEDSLPPYAELDPIIEAYIEDDLGVDDIVARGHDRDTVREVVRLIDRSEYKRRQAAPGVKITDRAFGRDRRVPITNRWRP